MEKGSVLSELMVRYPFSPHSRQFFEKLPIEESFSSNEVLAQAERRLLSTLGRIRYEASISELIEFSSFFVAALVASQDSNLSQRFANREADRVRKVFAGERTEGKPSIIRECFGFNLTLVGDESYELRFLAGVDDYLTYVTRHELNRVDRWKLVNQPLANGLIHLTENAVDDLFHDFAERMIYEGVKNLRRAPFPRQLVELREKILPFLPPQKVRSGRGYLYIEELMKHPVSDGRHRLVWLVLAPYLVNVKKVEEAEAIEGIRNYVAAMGETRAMKRFIEYNVRRAKRNGLMPPTLNKLKTEHPDLYSLLPKELIARFAPQ